MVVSGFQVATATRLLAEFAVAESATDAADRELLDRSLSEFVSAALVGGASDSAGRFGRLRSAIDPGGLHRAVGGHGASSASLAAWWNALAAGAAPLGDSDDLGSESSIVWSALLALSPRAENTDALRQAASVGLRAGHALARASGYRAAQRGFHARGVFGILAATVAASRLLGFDASRASAAISAAASFTGGLLAAEGSDAELLSRAAAARDAVLAVQMAEHGISGAPDILEGRQGFGEAYVGLAASTWASLEAELAKAVPIASAHRALAYAGHADHQRPLRALSTLLEGRAAADVESVVVSGVPPESEGSRFPDPRTGLQARRSLRYVLATMLERGRVAVADFDDVVVARRVDAGALDRVEVRSASRWDRSIEDPERDADRLVVRWRGGEASEVSFDADAPSAPADLVAAKWLAVAADLRSSHPARAALVADLWNDAGPSAEVAAVLDRASVDRKHD